MGDMRTIQPGHSSAAKSPRPRGGGAPNPNFSFRDMTRQDYFCLYDAIHTLVRQDEITKEQENVLYDLIGRQDKALAAAYQRYKDGGNPQVLLEPLQSRRGSKVGKP